MLCSAAVLVAVCHSAALNNKYSVVKPGLCNKQCIADLELALKNDGRPECEVVSVKTIKTKSFVAIDCAPKTGEASMKTVSAAAAVAAAKGMATTLGKAQSVNIEKVDLDQEMHILCSDHPEVSEEPTMTNPPLFPSPSTPPKQPGAPQPVPAGLWGVDEVDGTMDGNRCPSSSRLGEGVDVYILDSGCTADVGALCTSEIASEPTCADANSHGTHCAGTVNGKMYGVAPKATRHCLKVLGASGSGSTRGIIAAIAQVAEYHKKTGRKGVVNMSLGGGQSDSLNAAVNDASGDGLYFSLAAGNDNADACTKSPASATVNDPFAFTVCAHDKDRQAASFTNYGTCSDLSAPGVRIESDNGFKSGTSMAAPHVAGAMAVLLSDGKEITMQTLTGSVMVPRIEKPALQISC